MARPKGPIAAPEARIHHGAKIDLFKNERPPLRRYRAVRRCSRVANLGALSPEIEFSISLSLCSEAEIWHDKNRRGLLMRHEHGPGQPRRNDIQAKLIKQENLLKITIEQQRAVIEAYSSTVFSRLCGVS